jgi:putative phage-type endonuclease
VETANYSGPEYDFLDRAEVPRQQTEQWFEKRIGKVTGSRISEVMNYKRDKTESAERKNYRTEKIAEILTGAVQDHYVSPAMLWGREQENAARARYEIEEQTLVEQVDFVPWPEMADIAGGSPDGLVGTDGIIEIKCPNTTTHIDWMMGNKVPDQHRDQMLFYLACTGRQWADFVSYDSRLPAEFQFFIIRLDRDDERLEELRKEVIKFAAEVQAQIAFMRKLVKG